jgi:hypothetical protein
MNASVVVVLIIKYQPPLVNARDGWYKHWAIMNRNVIKCSTFEIIVLTNDWYCRSNMPPAVSF